MNDHQRISNLIGRYGQTVDEWPRQPDAYADLFTEDAEFTDNGVTIRSREKLRRLMSLAAEHTGDQPLLAGTRHLMLNTVIEVDGEQGTGSVDLLVIELSDQHGWRIRGSGRYHDQYVRDPDGAWRFRSRRLEWFKDGGPDPRSPQLGDAFAAVFQSVMDEAEST
ncbi:MAG: nuclear transport factor 2 family protein [Microthrixaceae bacterium]